MRSVPKLAGMLAMSLVVGCASTAERGEGGVQAKTRPSAPKITQAAPMFKLASLDGKRTVDLASYGGEKPILLFFGSYT